MDINNLLLKVEKPARYTGGEYNQPDVSKPHGVSLALCFPELYEVAMSNLGVRILYHKVNNQSDMVCERCFAPAPDLGKLLRETGTPLFSIESKRPLTQFDVIGFSVGYEMLYTNILYMMDLAGLPFYAKDRGEDAPILLAGGPCMVNPEPIAPFFDACIIGEGEDALPEFLAVVRDGKAEGLTKAEIIARLAQLPYVYVPQSAKTELVDGRECVTGITVKKAVVQDFENTFFPTKMLTPNIEIVHDRVVMELYRGCANGCRFCQAAFYYRPIRSRSAEKVEQLSKESLENTGYDEMSLSSLSTSDYRPLPQLLTKLKSLTAAKHVNLSLPSLRLDSFSSDYSEFSRRSSLTFAPEAGTQRLRNVINKNISDEDIEKSIIMAIKQGYTTIKLYFMIGLPTETQEDRDGIVEIVRKIKQLYAAYSPQKKARALNIHVSSTVFIPKPSTPFQFEAQMPATEVPQCQMRLKDALREIKGVKFSYHECDLSVLEAAFARGDRALAPVIARAYGLGAYFDSWTEHFKTELWTQAFADVGVDVSRYLCQYDSTHATPWDFIDIGVAKSYFIKEREKAYAGETTPSCLHGCTGCGAASLGRCNQ